MKKLIFILTTMLISLFVHSFAYAEAFLPDSRLFKDIIGIENADEIAFGTIVYDENKCADINEEDLKQFVNTYIDFSYDLVISPLEGFSLEHYYFKLWNKDKSKSFTIYSNSSVIVGTYGETANNYVWYLPYIGNARNALYIENKKIYDAYKENTRELIGSDKPFVPQENLLITYGCSAWAEKEIQKAASKNLMLYELSDKYTLNITRLDFCKLAYRTIATKFSPYSDSRMGMWFAIDTVINENGLREKHNLASFTDIDDDTIKFLTAAGIIKGVGDGKFAPNDLITREQAAVILYRMTVFLGNNISKPENEVYYFDEEFISNWAEKEVKAISQMGIMKGTGNNEFSPQGTYTVEQAVSTMLRLYEYE